MPEFYSRGYRFTAGKTYALAGGNTGYTSARFPNGASAMAGINALLSVGSIGATVDLVFINATGWVDNIYLSPGVMYPFRPSHMIVKGNDVFGFV